MAQVIILTPEVAFFLFTMLIIMAICYGVYVLLDLTGKTLNIPTDMVFLNVMLMISLILMAFSVRSFSSTTKDGKLDLEYVSRLNFIMMIVQAVLLGISIIAVLFNFAITQEHERISKYMTEHTMWLTTYVFTGISMVFFLVTNLKFHSLKLNAFYLKLYMGLVAAVGVVYFLHKFVPAFENWWSQESVQIGSATLIGLIGSGLTVATMVETGGTSSELWDEYAKDRIDEIVAEMAEKDAYVEDDDMEARIVKFRVSDSYRERIGNAIAFYYSISTNDSNQKSTDVKQKIINTAAAKYRSQNAPASSDPVPSAPVPQGNETGAVAPIYDTAVANKHGAPEYIMDL